MRVSPLVHQPRRVTVSLSSIKLRSVPSARVIGFFPLQANSKKCQSCGTRASELQQFCAECGAKLLQPAEVNPAGGSIRPVESARPVEAVAHQISPEPAPIAKAQVSEQPQQGPPAVKASALDAAGPVSFDPICRGCGSAVSAGQQHCRHCGKPVNTSAAPPAPAAVAPAAASPLAEANLAKLVIITQDGGVGASYPLGNQQIDIGRTEGQIRLSGDDFVSERHARLIWDGTGYRIRDLSSLNGIFLRLRTPQPLHDGDIILTGVQVLRFELPASEQGLSIAKDSGVELFGSPIYSREARLVEICSDGAPRNRWYISRRETVLGREVGDLVFADDAYMSRRHATIVKDASGRYILQDLGSSNGTFIALRGETRLHAGDHLRIGQHLFRYQVQA